MGEVVFPRAGHAGDLQEWAKRHDAESQKTVSQRLETEIEDLKTRLVELIGEDRVTEIVARELGIRIDTVARLATAQAQIVHGRKMADVFDGEAMNA